MHKVGLQKSIPVEAFKQLLIYEPRRYHDASWSYYIMQLMPYSKMMVVADFDSFVKALQDSRYDFTTIVMNWDSKGGHGESGGDRIQVIRSISKYQDTPVCIFSEKNEIPARDRFLIGEHSNIIYAFGQKNSLGVLRVMDSRIDGHSLRLFLGDEQLKEVENLVKGKDYYVALERLSEITPLPRLLIRKYLLLLRCYVATGQYKQGKELFEELIKLNVHSPSIFRLGADIYQHLGNPAWSLQFTEIRYRAYPSNSQAVVDYARGLISTGKKDEAIELLQKESQRTGSVKAPLYSLLVEVLVKKLDLLTLESVLSRWDCALSEETISKMAHFAMSLSQSGNSEDAAQIISLLIPQCKSDGIKAYCHFLRGRVYYISGDLVAAISEFSQSIIVGPWSDQVAKALLVACMTASDNRLGYDHNLVRRATRERMDEVRAQLGQTLEATLENAAVPYGLKKRTREAAERAKERLRRPAERMRRTRPRQTAKAG